MTSKWKDALRLLKIIDNKQQLLEMHTLRMIIQLQKQKQMKPKCFDFKINVNAYLLSHRLLTILRTTFS